MNIALFTRKVLSIDFGASEIKVIEGKYTKKGIKISKAISQEIPEGSYQNGEILKKEEMVGILRDLLSENKISTKRAYAVIASSSIIIRELSIPKVEEKEIAGILSFQIEDIFPVDSSNYIINYLIVGSSFDGEIESWNLLVIGIVKTMVEEHFELLEEAGLKPQVMDFQGNAISKLLSYSNNINDSYTSQDMIICSIDMGYDSSKLSIIKNGRTEISTIIGIGFKNIYKDISNFFEYSRQEIKEKIANINYINNQSDEITEENRIINIMRFTIESLLEEIDKILKFYRARSLENNIDVILLQGGMARIQGIEELCSNFLDIETAVLESTDKIDLNIDLVKYSNAIGGLIRMDGV